MPTAAKIVILLVVVSLTTGCASFDNQLKPWNGRTVDELTDRWGPPEAERESENGGRTMKFVVRKTTGIGSILHAATSTDKKPCFVTFWLGADDKISRYAYEGSCVNAKAPKPSKP